MFWLVKLVSSFFDMKSVLHWMRFYFFLFKARTYLFSFFKDTFNAYLNILKNHLGPIASMSFSKNLWVLSAMFFYIFSVLLTFFSHRMYRMIIEPTFISSNIEGRSSYTIAESGDLRQSIPISSRENLLISSVKFKVAKIFLGWLNSTEKCPRYIAAISFAFRRMNFISMWR